MQRHFISAAAAVAVIALLLSVQTAHAQQQFLDGLKMTPQADARHVSMLFHKMAGFQPDFEAWIENSEEYKRTPQQQRRAYMNERLDILHDYYARIKTDDRVVVYFKTQVPPYDREKGGFQIQGVKKDIFFGYEYEGGRFALVPTDAMDYEFFILPEDRLAGSASFDMDRGGAAIFHFHLRPKSIDTTTPYSLDNAPHWLIATEIVEIQMWDHKNQKPFWVMYKKQ